MGAAPKRFSPLALARARVDSFAQVSSPRLPNASPPVDIKNLGIDIFIFLWYNISGRNRRPISCY